MAGVFLSYDREDLPRARSLALALEKAGHSVWWDRHIKGGAEYNTEIEAALSRADAIVVLWSERSVRSAWVRDEAAAGRDTGRLVPVTISRVEPPLGFRQYQTTDLSTWKGRKTPEFEEMLEAIASLPEASQKPDAGPPPLPLRARGWRFTRPFTVAIALSAVAAVGLVGWTLIGQPSSVPVIAVAAADPSPASQALARDLLVKLGSLPTARPDSIELISNDETAKTPTLILQVSRSGPREGAEANLTLTDASNRSLLWSKDFRDPNGNDANLRKQLAYSAAYALRCALKGMDPGAERLSREALKTYVNACATSPDASMVDVVASMPGLRKLVREVPTFRGGWAMLLMAESFAFFGPEGETMRPFLAKHIAEARKLHAHLPEAYIAEGLLIPGAQFLKRSRLLDQGVERNPDSAELRFMRHHFLASVGRTEEALRDARRSMELDPLSPEIRWGYITSLGLAGRMDDALAALNEAERLWPEGPAVRAARLTLHFNAGDPREALRLLRAGAAQEISTPWIRVQKTLLQARIDRSPENVERAIRMAATRYNQRPQSIDAFAPILAEFDREEELFRILLNWRRMDLVTNVADVLFRPAFADFHKDPRFMQVAKRLGLLDYWRASGKWPDLCSRPDLRYDCKKEAAKLN